MQSSARELLDELLRHRILVLDGAMGTMLQQRGLTEADYRGTRFRHHSRNLHGNHDVLTLTRPDVISSIHHSYLDVGADIIETNTFSATAVAQAPYGLESLAYELSASAARLAKAAAREWTRRTPDKPRFVAGSIGPTSWKLSQPDPKGAQIHGAASIDALRDAYKDQVRGLIDEGCDLLLIETIVDALNTRAALEAIDAVVDRRRNDVPLMVSVTIGKSGTRTLAGQSLEAFWSSVADAHPFVVGINCSFGARPMKAALAELACVSDSWVSCHPSAGLPDALGNYRELPEETASLIREVAQLGLMNIAGGCCGTTPAHIQAIAHAVNDVSPRRRPTTLEP
jgi:5-methyltetrahydrofolate--homocysteine methyltransferase